jgi:hypothetical protein
MRIFQNEFEIPNEVRNLLEVYQTLVKMNML